MRQFESESWERALARSEDYIIEGGPDFGHAVSAFNYSRDGEDQKVVSVISWSKHHEDVFQDAQRGGCQCSIF